MFRYGYDNVDSKTVLIILKGEFTSVSRLLLLLYIVIHVINITTQSERVLTVSMELTNLTSILEPFSTTCSLTKQNAFTVECNGYFTPDPARYSVIRVVALHRIRRRTAPYAVRHRTMLCRAGIAVKEPLASARC